MLEIEEIDCCCLCLEGSSIEYPFINPNPCDCKGSIKFHDSCSKELMRRNIRCGICKKKYPNIDFSKRFSIRAREALWNEWILGIRHNPALVINI